MTDCLNNSLINATVLLLEEDSTMIEFTQSELDGTFAFTKIPYGNYIVKVTYVGYIPQSIPIDADKKDIDLGRVVLNEISVELMEVVVKAARAPLKMRGDTLEFDITQFKVPENSTLEDLIRRLPGMEVEQGGGIKMDGKDVTSVKVEGKSFFGNNPTVATKNLPAQGVSSVQVYDKKTDDQVATGNTTPTNEKEMNVVLKDDFKNIVFGKGTVGGGNIDRFEGKFSFNKFTPEHQFSVIGVGNNTGRNGLGWDDREDFFGNQAYSDFESLKYGFNSLGGMRIIYFSDENDLNLEGKISELFNSSGSGGLPRNATGGANYNYDREKIKLGARYLFNYRGNELNSFSSVNRFLPGNITNFDTTTSNNINTGNVHRIEAAFTGEIDSFNTLKVNADFGMLASQNNSNRLGLAFRNGDELISSSSISSDRNNDGMLGRGSIVYNKTFRKKSRFLGINSSYAASTLAENTGNLSQIDFENTDDTYLNQSFDNDARKKQIMANLMYNEPLGKKYFFSVFHNFDHTSQTGDVLVEDIFENERSVNEQLTRNYDTRVMTNFSGASLRYSSEGLNIAAGYGYQFTDLYGDFNIVNKKVVVDTTFKLPSLVGNINYQISRNGSVGVNFSRSVTPPQISQLIPIVNNANPLYIRVGNPNLEPETTNSVSGNIWLSKPLSGMRFSLWGDYQLRQNAVTQSEEVSENFVTTTTPINYKSRTGLTVSGNLGFPIVKNKVTSSARLYVNQSGLYRLVNAVENFTKTFSVNPGLNVNITPSQNFYMYLNGGVRMSNTKYDISSAQNQKIITQNYSATLNFQIVKTLFFNSNYSHAFYRNDRTGQNNSIPIINASIYKQFLPGNKAEIRLAVYDILNKNTNYNLFAGNNIVSENETQTLARYFMVMFSYNLKGLNSGINNN